MMMMMMDRLMKKVIVSI